MRGEFRAIWRVSFALMLALSVELVMTPGGEVVAANQVSFNNSGTFNWTVPAGVTQITVEVWGGGGGGGGSLNVTDCEGQCAAGGGGGAYASSNLTVSSNQTLYIVVGAGGAGGIYGDDGTDGDDSFVGPDINSTNADVLAAGGSGGGGNTGSGNPPGGPGGSEGDCVGDSCLDGGDGGDGCTVGLCCSGAGGDAANTIPPEGSGGAAVCGVTTRDGNPGTEPGGGGGGSRTSGTSSPTTGGAGADGRVVIKWTPSVMYYLTINSTACGNVTTPGEGTWPYAAGTGVSLIASPNAGCYFVNWTGDVGTIGNANAAVTTFTMPAKNATLTAHFAVTPVVPCYELRISSTDCCNVTTPGEGTFTYLPGTVVNLVVTLGAGCRFVNWTGDVGTIANVTAASTTITMNWCYTIVANCEEIPGYDLTISSTTGGTVTTPGEGTFTYDVGDVVNLVASPGTGYQFDNWTGDVATIADVNDATTTITMNGNYGITANFEVAPPSVTTQSATGVTTDSATLNMNYTVGNYSSVQVCFVYKKSTDSAWSSPDWVSKSADGTYAKSLTGLDSGTLYNFKAQLKYNDTVIEGTTRQFTTDTPETPEASGGYCFIATAAYGTPTAEQIDVLREFRDVVLLESTVGSQFVTLYYRLSPPVADFIARSDLLRTLVRELLVDPIVWVVEATGAIWQN